MLAYIIKDESRPLQKIILDRRLKMPYQDLYSELELIPIVTFEAKSYNIPCSISEEYRAAYYFSYTLSDGVEEFYKALYRFLSPKFLVKYKKFFILVNKS